MDKKFFEKTFQNIELKEFIGKFHPGSIETKEIVGSKNFLDYTLEDFKTIERINLYGSLLEKSNKDIKNVIKFYLNYCDNLKEISIDTKIPKENGKDNKFVSVKNDFFKFFDDKDIVKLLKEKNIKLYSRHLGYSMDNTLFSLDIKDLEKTKFLKDFYIPLIAEKCKNNIINVENEIINLKSFAENMKRQLKDIEKVFKKEKKCIEI